MIVSLKTFAGLCTPNHFLYVVLRSFASTIFDSRWLASIFDGIDPSLVKQTVLGLVLNAAPDTRAMFELLSEDCSDYGILISGGHSFTPLRAPPTLMARLQ